MVRKEKKLNAKGNCFQNLYSGKAGNFRSLRKLGNLTSREKEKVVLGPSFPMKAQFHPKINPLKKKKMKKERNPRLKCRIVSPFHLQPKSFLAAPVICQNG